MKKQQPSIRLSEAEIRGIYRQGEEAVVSLVSQLLERLAKLETQVTSLQGQLKKDSHNSSKPPSGDGFGKRTKSLRQKSEKRSGGQPGHEGHTLEWSASPDEVIIHRVESCSACGQSLESAAVEEILARQVLDIPPLELRVSEHQLEVKCCPHCGESNSGEFPVEASNVVQYGPRLKGIMVYLMEAQLLPSHRTCEVLSEILNVPVSEGTLYTTRQSCFEHLETIEQEIRQEIQNSEVVHFDETGMRVNQHLWWLHVAATDGLTYYFVHPKRGQIAIDEMGILPGFESKAIHDGWRSYQRYECEHFLCNAHHLRELQYIQEHYGQSWAFQLSLLLVTIHTTVEIAKTEGKQALSPQELADFAARYEAVLVEGFAANPLQPPPTDQTKKRGRTKRPPPLNLLERLQTHRISVLGFMYDFAIPFDNNQAERDLRMMKLKQKISGCFRSEEGARCFCRIRGYLSTLRKQGRNVLDALVRLFSGNPLSPIRQPE